MLIAGGVLLSLNIGCYRHHYTQNLDFGAMQDPEPENLENKIETEKPSGLKAWQYPLNLFGGYMLTAVQHESGHALAAVLQGAEIDRFDIFYTDEAGNNYACAVIYDEGTYPEFGSTEDSIITMAGPLGERLFVEAINYNLRNGNIARNHQPFWATTSLMSRCLLIWSAAGALEGKTQNDFYIISQNTGISPEELMGIVLLDAALNYKRMAKEFRVAIGRDTYPTNQEKKISIDVLPSPNGIGLSCAFSF